MKREAYGWADYVLEYIQADVAKRNSRGISAASQARIRDLLRLTMRVDGLLEMVFSTRNGWGPDGFQPVVDAIEDLNKRFEEYPSLIGVDYDPNFKREPRFTEKVGSVFHPVAEGLAARYIFTLAEDQNIRNFRECLCKKLFFARREDQTSCSPACRHKKYEQTEEYKRNRRTKAREIYLLHKKGNVKESHGK